MWNAIRERQRQSSIALSRDLAKRGSCERALESLERAQTRQELGAFAAESVWLKAGCLDTLGRGEEALAHWRLLREQYGDTRWAQRIPEEVAPRLGAPEALRARPAPNAFEVPRPRYGDGAEREGLEGPVWVEYRLDREGRPEEIRIVGTAHPLLASYAVEAVAAGRWRASAGGNTPLPRRAATVFRFADRWSSDEDAADDAPDGAGRDEDGGIEIEWFPDS